MMLSMPQPDALRPTLTGLPSMRDLLAELTTALNQRRPCVYCAVVETRGSTPQKAGAAMLVFPDGSQRGTLGGGKGGEDGKPVAYKPLKVGLELVDLDADLSETTKVADKHPDVVKRLQALAEQAREDMGDSLTKRVGKGAPKGL
jgi:XdhC and CoxI family